MPADPLSNAMPLVPGPPLSGGQGIPALTGDAQGGFSALLIGQGVVAASVPVGEAKPPLPVGALAVEAVVPQEMQIEAVQAEVPPPRVPRALESAVAVDASRIPEEQGAEPDAPEPAAEESDSVPVLAPLPMPVPMTVAPAPPRADPLPTAGPAKSEDGAPAPPSAPRMEGQAHAAEQMSFGTPQSLPSKADHAGKQTEPGPRADAGSDALPPLVPSPSRDATPLAPPRAEASPVIAAASPRFGEDLGIAIARHAARGPDASAETLTVRLDPPEHGRIEVSLQFEDGGPLRIVMTASQSATLDLLRRDSADLSRALSQAGVSTDAQSFSFGSQSGEGQQGRPGPHPSYPGQTWREEDAGALPLAPPQRIRTSGSLNLIA